MPARRASTRKSLEFSAGAFVGVDDTGPPSQRPPYRLRFSANMMPDGIHGGAWCTRPGFGDPNNIAGRTYGRGIRHLSTSAGNEWTAWFFDDRFYLGPFETAPSNVTLSGGVAITAQTPSTPAKYLIASETFKDWFIFSDSVNKPWLYAPDTTTFTLLSDAPVARSVPTVYYGKLFFIKDSSPITIVWSEEGDPTTGYEAGDYENAWDLTQVSGEPLTAILGTNDALFFWRQSAFDMIRGEVSDDFAASGTVSGISTDIGTRSPHTVHQVGRHIWFLDQYGRPCRYQIGGEIEPLWKQAQHALRNTNPTAYPYASAAHYAAAGVVVFLIPSDLVTTPSAGMSNIMLAFDDQAGEYLGTWHDAASNSDYSTQPLDAHVIGTVKRLKEHRLAHIGGSLARSFIWHLPGDSTESATLGYQKDRFGATPQAILSQCVFGPLGESSDHKVFDRVIVSLAGGGAVTNLSVAYRTAEGAAPTAQTVSVAALTEAGSGVSVVPHAEQRAVVGTLARTRWIQPRLSHATMAEVLSVSRITVRGMTDSADPYGI